MSEQYRDRQGATCQIDEFRQIDESLPGGRGTVGAALQSPDRFAVSLSGLINLTVLVLNNCAVSDIRPLATNAGLGAGDIIDLRNNNLTAANCPDLKTLSERGATVQFSPQRKWGINLSLTRRRLAHLRFAVLKD